MMSSFTWLDYSEHERRRALDVISLFKYQGTRDELGLASIRDALAECFFPGTTTIQTRARYFLFVPWLCLELERKGVSSDKAGRRLRSAEEALIGQLIDSADSDGVIGKEVGKAIKRMPSSIYWAGMKRWGILMFDGSLAQYHRSLDRFYLRVKSHRALVAENSEATPEPSNWHAHLPTLPSKFPEGQSMELEPPEAVYLRERILSTCSGSLLAYLADQRAPWAPVDFAWEYEGLESLPDALKRRLGHARAFSEVMHGAAILYNVMLSRAADSDAWLSVHEAAFEEWAQQEHQQGRRMEDWDLTVFWQIASDGGARISYSSRAFVEAWVRRIRQLAHPRELSGDAVALRLVQSREVALKKGRARLANRRYLELWNGASGTGQFDLRWRISQRLLLDILGALSGFQAARRPNA